MTPWLLFTRDLALAYRRGGGALAAAGFCLVAFCVFAFALGPEVLHASAHAVLAVAVFLACLLALPGLFARDAQDGTLEQYLLAPAPLEALVAAKLAAFWCAFALPLLALTPLLALMAGMSGLETLSRLYASARNARTGGHRRTGRGADAGRAWIGIHPGAGRAAALPPAADLRRKRGEGRAGAAGGAFAGGGTGGVRDLRSPFAGDVRLNKY